MAAGFTAVGVWETVVGLCGRRRHEGEAGGIARLPRGHVPAHRLLVPPYKVIRQKEVVKLV